MLFDNQIGDDMVEMKDDPKHPRDQYNTTPFYAAVFRLRGQQVSSG